MTNSIEAYKTKIYQLIFGSAVVGIGLVVLKKSVATGSSRSIYIVAVLMGLAALILALDKYYWALGCFLIFLIDIPHVKISGLELGAAVLVCMYFLQSIFRREASCKPEFPTFALLAPFLAWIALCFIQNPCGLYIFGSRSIGFRFYVTLTIGVAALFVLSRMAFSEKHAKILFWIAMGGALSFLAVSARIVQGAVSGAVFSDSLHYEFMQMKNVAMLILCRFPLKRILSDWRILTCFATSSFLCIYTGNRTTAMTPAVSMFLLPFLRRKERVTIFVVFAFAVFGIGFLAAGQGKLYRLPQGIQKSLSFIPADWDDRWQSYGFKDTFRDELRQFAKELIREKPWMGRKGFAMNLESASWILATAHDNSGHAFSGNWHNLWLGLAADFGIPCAVFFAIFYTFAIVYAYRNVRIFPSGSWSETMYLFVFLRFLLILLISNLGGGHSAKTPQEAFLWFGFCLALINGRKMHQNRSID